jgi:sorting nexin-9/18/33
MAEMETYHRQKIDDFTALTKEHLDGEIDFYEQVLIILSPSHPSISSLVASLTHCFFSPSLQVLSRLQAARRTFDEDPSSSPGPCQPSIYDRELENPRLQSAPLMQPCPHVFDSAPMRPVSVALQEGVGMLQGGFRSSVFGKFW